MTYGKRDKTMKIFFCCVHISYSYLQTNAEITTDCDNKWGQFGRPNLIVMKDI